jgi:hypothetical protein
MDGLSANNAANGTLAAMNPDGLPDRYDAVVPAYCTEVEQAFIADVMDNESDLVHVASQHDLGLGLGVQDRSNVPMHISRNRWANGFT